MSTTHAEIPEGPLSLAELIRRHKDATGDSYQDLATKCGLSKSKIGHIATTGAQYQVQRGTIEKLAKGLGLPVRVVQHAALVTAGVADVSDGREMRIDLIASRLALLDDDAVEMIGAMVDAAVRRKAADG